VCIGTIRASASKVLSSQICAIGLKAPVWNFKILQDESSTIVKSQYPNHKIDSAKIVCYSYPKIGMKLQLQNTKSGEVKNVFIDAVDYSIVSTKESESRYMVCI
jgi:hypothetical protein